MKPKLVKSFNEFLNLTSISKNRLASQLSVDSVIKSAVVVNPKFTVTSAGNESPVNSIDSIETPVATSRKIMEESSPDDSQDYFPMTTSMTRELKMEMENLDRQVFGNNFNKPVVAVDVQDELVKSPFLKNASGIGYFQLSNQASSSIDAIEEDNQIEKPKEIITKVKMRKKIVAEETNLNRISSCSNNNDVFTWQNPLNQFGSSEFNHTNLQIHERSSSIQNTATTPDEQADIEFDQPGEIIEMSHGKKSVTPIRLVRKKESGIKASSGKGDRRSTMLEESSSESDDQKSQIKLNANNPFYEQIQQMNKKMDENLINCCEEQSVESPDVKETDNADNHEGVTELPPPSRKKYNLINM